MPGRQQHPSPVELYTKWESLRLRESRAIGGNKRDNPMANVLEGQAEIVVGFAALVFAIRSIRRAKSEKSILLKMFNENMTIKKLKNIAKNDINNLPSTVLLTGLIQTKGKPVFSITEQVTSLKASMGKITPPHNLLIRKEKNVSKDLENGFALSEIFITRIGCLAKKIRGKNRMRIIRRPRETRFNVFHHRNVSDGGLQFVDGRGDMADIKLPEFNEVNLKNNDSPPLFLSLPDLMNEYKRYAGFKRFQDGKALTHKSNFIFVDQSSETDDGGFKHDVENNNQDSETYKYIWKHINGLDQIANLVPNDAPWVFAGKGFYDNNPGNWSSFPDTYVSDYQTFKKRMNVAAEENAKWQTFTIGTPKSMRKARDVDNGFRVVELGIPNHTEVTILAKPAVSEDGKDICLCPPTEINYKKLDKARFSFRIVQGHTIDNLMKLKLGSIRVYKSFAWVAIFSILYGEELIRDAYIIPEFNTFFPPL